MIHVPQYCAIPSRELCLRPYNQPTQMLAYMHYRLLCRQKSRMVKVLSGKHLLGIEEMRQAEAQAQSRINSTMKRKTS